MIGLLGLGLSDDTISNQSSKKADLVKSLASIYAMEKGARNILVVKEQ